MQREQKRDWEKAVLDGIAAGLGGPVGDDHGPGQVQPVIGADQLRKARTLSRNFLREDDAGASEEAQLKSTLAREIAGVIKGRKLTQTAAAALLSLRQPDVSAIANGRTEKFSVGRLIRCLDRLDHRVHVEVRPKPLAERRLPSSPK